jgi:hypothetical protein
MQVKVLLNPKSTLEIQKNVAYSINTIVQVLLILRSFKKNVSPSTTLYPAFILLLIRMIFKLVDMNQGKENEWFENVLMIFSVFYINLTFFIIAFNH